MPPANEPNSSMIKETKNSPASGKRIEIRSFISDALGYMMRVTDEPKLFPADKP